MIMISSPIVLGITAPQSAGTRCLEKGLLSMRRNTLATQPPTADVGRQHRKGPERSPLNTEVLPKQFSLKASIETNPVALLMVMKCV